VRAGGGRDATGVDPTEDDPEPMCEHVRDRAIGDGLDLLIVRLRGFGLVSVRPALAAAYRVGDQPATRRTKGVDMPKVVITHAVQDIDRWLQGKAERAAAIESGTGGNVTDYVAHDGSNNIAITADVQDVDALQGMLASPTPEVAAAMESHGVVQPISAYVAAE
jgi:hypothetical protein